MRGGDKFSVGLAEVSRSINKTSRLKVGIVRSATYPDGTQIAQNAYWQEYGTDKIPPRPVYRLVQAKYGAKWTSAFDTLVKQDATLKSLGRLGELIKGQIVREYIAISDPPNAPSTVAKKGFNKPLVDTGTMWRSVDWSIGND